MPDQYLLPDGQFQKADFHADPIPDGTAGQSELRFRKAFGPKDNWLHKFLEPSHPARTA